MTIISRQGIWPERELAALVGNSGRWRKFDHCCLKSSAASEPPQIPARVLVEYDVKDLILEFLEPLGGAETDCGVV